MFRADSFEDMSVGAAMKSFEGIFAQDAHVVLILNLVPEFLKLNCRLCIILCTQEIHAFCENGNARFFLFWHPLPS
jgi:hypothetical protein